MNIEFPYKPWKHQTPIIRAVDEGCKRIVLVWHRRAGKDLTCFNVLLRQALKRIGTYFHFFPTLKLGKKILWDGMDSEGRRYRDYIPHQLIEGKPSETELKIRLKNGSIIQVMSVEDISKSAVGTNCMGAVFSEYAAYATGEAWDLVRPILAANDGFALFAYTPRGHNHGYRLYEDAKTQHDWMTSLLSVDGTIKPDGARIVGSVMIDADRRSGMPAELIQQEYYCSFEGFMQGGFFSDQYQWAKDDERITDVPWNPHIPVNTVCDIGKGMNFASWFFQRTRDNINVIRFHESPSGSITEFCKYVKDLPYFYDKHYCPFDGAHATEEAGVRRVDTARELGINWIALQKLPVEERINAGRLVFPMTRFDRVLCRDGLVHLQNYRRKWNEKLEQYDVKELADRHSHGGAAFSYLGVACRDKVVNTPHLPKQADMNFSPLAKRGAYDMGPRSREIYDLDTLRTGSSRFFSSTR